MHYMLGPYGRPELLPVTEIVSVCHRSGAEVAMQLAGGHLSTTSHPDAVVCFTAPLREWYADLVDT